jgi:hypothetical protein
MNYTRNIINESTFKEFILKVEYLPIKEKEVNFRFSNNLFLLEKRILKIENQLNEQVFPYGIKSIIPKNLEEEKTQLISKNNPFIYIIKGNIIDKGERFLLEFKSVEYLLDKGVEYSIYLESENNQSNKLTFKY